MALSSGSHRLGPGSGRLELRTYREGVAAAVGHDLVIEATRWSGTLTTSGEPAGSSVEVTVEVAGLAVREGTGGVRPLTDRDRADIEKTMRQKILRVADHPTVTFRSTAISATGDRGTVTGELTVGGRTAPLDVTVRLVEDDGGTRVTGEAAVPQTDWGIRPYRGFLGALRLRDVVDVTFDITL